MPVKQKPNVCRSFFSMSTLAQPATGSSGSHWRHPIYLHWNLTLKFFV